MCAFVPMRKLFPQLVALLLVSCLIAESSLAVTLSHQRSLAGCFIRIQTLQEALALRPIVRFNHSPSMNLHPFVSESRLLLKERAERPAVKPSGGHTRRWFMRTAVLGVGSLIASTNAPAEEGIQPEAPVNRDDFSLRLSDEQRLIVHDVNGFYARRCGRDMTAAQRNDFETHVGVPYRQQPWLKMGAVGAGVTTIFSGGVLAWQVNAMNGKPSNQIGHGLTRFELILMAASVGVLGAISGFLAWFGFRWSPAELPRFAGQPAQAVTGYEMIRLDQAASERWGASPTFRYIVAHEFAHRYGQAQLLKNDPLFADAYAILYLLHTGGMALVKEALTGFGQQTSATFINQVTTRLRERTPQQMEEEIIDLIKDGRHLSTFNFHPRTDGTGTIEEIAAMRQYADGMAAIAWHEGKGDSGRALDFLERRIQELENRRAASIGPAPHLGARLPLYAA
jgi:hypothetical protein